MLPRNDLTIAAVGRTEPVARTERIGEPGQDEFQRSMAQMANKPLLATVAARLADGSFLVNLNDTMARMQLPANAQVGATLNLTLIALTPRPTFALNTDGQSATLVASAPPGAASRAAPLAATSAASTTTPGGGILPLPLPARGALVTGAPLVTTTPAGNTLPMTGMPLAAQGAALPSAPPSALPPAVGAPPGVLASHAHAAALLSKSPLTPSALLPTGDVTVSAAMLSQTAQLLSAVLRTALSQPGATGRVLARSPIAAAPGMVPSELAGALDEAVSKSGLFYESHVAEWSRGQRSIGQLAQEPLMQQMQQLLRAGVTLDTVRRQMAPTEPAIAQVIDLQLQVQEQQRVAWQGQLWPGQDMRWEIERHAEGDAAAPNGQPDEDAVSWHSTLTLRFAALGEIGARLVLSGDQVLLRLDAGSEDVASLLRARSAELELALNSGGNFASVSIGTAPAPGAPAGSKVPDHGQQNNG